MLKWLEVGCSGVRGCQEKEVLKSNMEEAKSKYIYSHIALLHTNVG